MVEEIRRFLEGLAGVRTRLESDHALNLLMELRGDLPDEHARLLAVVDVLLALPEDDQILFVLGRRTNRLSFLGQLERPGTREELAALRAECLPDGQDPETVFRALRLRWI